VHHRRLRVISNPMGLKLRSTRLTLRVGYEIFEGRGVFGLLGSAVDAMLKIEATDAKKSEESANVCQCQRNEH
jgi:hypothetical protein